MTVNLFPTKPLARAGTLVVDAHGHAGAPKVDALISQRPEFDAGMKRMAEGTGPASMKHNAEVMLPLAGRKFARIDERMRDLDLMGIDRQVVCPSPHIYSYWADEALAEEIVGLANEAMTEVVGQCDGRLAAMGLVALQPPDLAACQLREAMAVGLKGVEISSSVMGRELSDPTLDPVWAAAEETGAVVFIHPLGTSLGARLAFSYLSNTIGQPTETTIALSHMIFSGVFDRFPKLKVFAAHGGGYLPHYIGRSDHAWRVRPEARGCAKRPSEYLRQIWFDTVVFDDHYLGHMLERVGAEKVMFGTDYAFDMGDYDPARVAGSISDSIARAAVMGGTASDLFGLT